MTKNLGSWSFHIRIENHPTTVHTMLKRIKHSP